MRPDAGPRSQGPSAAHPVRELLGPGSWTKPSLRELTRKVSPRCPPRQTAIPESQQQPLRGHRQSPPPACPSCITKGWRTAFLARLGTYFFRPRHLGPSSFCGRSQAGLSYCATQPLVGATAAPPLPLLYIKCDLLSRVQLFETPWTGSCQATVLLCPWGSPGEFIGVGCHALLQGIFPTQG